MPVKRDLNQTDTTFGTRHEDISPVFEYPADSIQHGQATVNGSATLRAANKKRRRITVFNRGGVEIFIGIAGVLTTDGYPIPPSGKETFTTSAAIIVTSAAASDMRFIEELFGVDA